MEVSFRVFRVRRKWGWVFCSGGWKDRRFFGGSCVLVLSSDWKYFFRRRGGGEVGRLVLMVFMFVEVGGGEYVFI